MDSTYSLIEQAVRKKGIKVQRADKKQVAEALGREGINPDDYNFSLEKKDIMIDAYESGDTIYMYKGYGKSRALCHEYIHKWWKNNGNETYAKIVQKKFPNKWSEVTSSQEYSQILDNNVEIAGEVLAKSLEQELSDYIEKNKNNIKGIKKCGIGDVKSFNKEDYCRCICSELFDNFGNASNFSIFEKVFGSVGYLMF